MRFEFEGTQGIVGRGRSRKCSVTFLFKVEDTFQVSGRGLFIVPDVPRSKLTFPLRANDRIQLRTPAGRVLGTFIRGTEILCGPEVKDKTAFQLAADIAKQDVPNGTEVWLTLER